MVSRVKPDDPAFQSAFVAVSYLLAQRVPELASTFASPHSSALAAAEQLASPDREVRRRALVVELERVGRGLEARRLA